MGSSDRTDVGYWITIVVLLILGYFTGFTIGPIFWFVAVVMIVLAPFKSRARVFRSGVALFAGFIVGFLLVTPLGCSQTASGDVATGDQTLSPVVCSSIIGIDYSGPEPFEPSVIPALLVGGGLAVVAAGATWFATGRAQEREKRRIETEAH